MMGALVALPVQVVTGDRTQRPQRLLAQPFAPEHQLLFKGCAVDHQPVDKVAPIALESRVQFAAAGVTLRQRNVLMTPG